MRDTSGQQNVMHFHVRLVQLRIKEDNKSGDVADEASHDSQVVVCS